MERSGRCISLSPFRAATPTDMLRGRRSYAIGFTQWFGITYTNNSLALWLWIMCYLALFLNFLLPGLGTLTLHDKRVLGFIQLFLTIVNCILVNFSGSLSILIHLGLFAWALATTISFIIEHSVKKVIQQERERQ